MENPLDQYWKLRLNDCAEALNRNNFEVKIAHSESEACWQVLDMANALLSHGDSIGFGGSQTVINSGIYEGLLSCKHFNVIDHFAKGLSHDESMKRRKEAAVARLYLTGANAVTESGMLVNLDGIGNRVSAMTIGPEYVIVLAGRNKIVPDLEAAIGRIKEIAAPANAIRLGVKTPCALTGRCSDCRSPARICNVWTIHEKCSPAGRIKVILINDDLGL